MKLIGKLNEATGAYEFEMPDAEKPAVKQEVAVLESPNASIAKIFNMEVMGLPVGNVVVGGAASILITEVVDGAVQKLMSKTSAGNQKMAAAGVKVAAALGTIKYGKKFVGNDAAKFIGALILFDALRDATPIDEMVNGVANKITGFIPVGGLGDFAALARFSPATLASSLGHRYTSCQIFR